MILYLLYTMQSAYSGNAQAIPVNTGSLSLWLAFATPVSVVFLGMVQAFVMRWWSAKLDHQGQQIQDIHVFTNSALGASLRVTAIALRQVANMTHSPLDADAALKAEMLSADHDSSQRMINARKGAI